MPEVIANGEADAGNGNYGQVARGFWGGNLPKSLREFKSPACDLNGAAEEK